MYSVTYAFNPGDTIYIQDKDSVKQGTCMQTNIQLMNDASNQLQTQITYLVLLKCDVGTVVVESEDAYATVTDALTALQNYLETLTCPVSTDSLSYANHTDTYSVKSYANYEQTYCQECSKNSK